MFGVGEMHRSFDLSAQVKQLQKYIPEIRVEDVDRYLNHFTEIFEKTISLIFFYKFSVSAKVIGFLPVSQGHIRFCILN